MVRNVVRTIVVGTDGSPSANAAVAEALDLARSEGARVHFVVSYPDPSRIREHLVSTSRDEHVDLRSIAEGVLVRAGRAAEDAGVEFDTHAHEEDPADAIIEVAEQVSADLVVVGHRGLKAASRFLVGSVSTKVMHHAPCSVMVVRSR